MTSTDLKLLSLPECYAYAERSLHPITHLQVVHKEGVLKLTAKELHSFDSMSAFAVMLRHTYKATALELGDGKADLNAEWLPQLCCTSAGL